MNERGKGDLRDGEDELNRIEENEGYQMTNLL